MSVSSEQSTDFPENAYRRIEKMYKIRYMQKKKIDKLGRKKTKRPQEEPMPSLDGVLDFRNIEKNSDNNKAQIVQIKDTKQWLDDHKMHMDQARQQFNKVHGEAAHLLAPNFETNFQLYGLKDYPGFYFMPNIISEQQQLHWAKQCLDVYLQPPNFTNLYANHGHVPDIFQTAVKEKYAQQQDKVAKKEEEMESKQTAAAAATDATKLLQKLTWCTLGFQYDWSERKYSADKIEPFPEDLGSYISLIACASGYGPYIPEASIINFYQPEQTMGGHLDNVEKVMDKPIVSISLGNDAIFLLGGETRDIEPIPVFVRSGDIMIMGGRARYCYHGIARIIHHTLPDHLKPENVEPQFKEHCTYLAGNRRINVNVRQVFYPDDKEMWLREQKQEM